MKKTRLFLASAVMLVFTANGFTQSSDIGYDWDPGMSDPYKLILATSEVTFTEAVLSYQVNAGNDNQLDITVVGSGEPNTIAKPARHNDVYVNDGTIYKSSTHSHSYIQLAGGSNVAYLEGAVKEDRVITALKFNGTTASTSNPTVTGLLYSDKIPFDETNVIAYTTVEFPACRAGEAGVVITDIPAGVKSFRIYGRAQVVPNENDGYEIKDSVVEGETTTKPEGAIEIGTGKASARIAYVHVAIAGNASSVGSLDAGNKVIVKKAYFDLSGRQVSESAAKGILIQKNTYEDGTDAFEKVFIK